MNKNIKGIRRTGKEKEISNLYNGEKRCLTRFCFVQKHLKEWRIWRLQASEDHVSSWRLWPVSIYFIKSLQQWSLYIHITQVLICKLDNATVKFCDRVGVLTELLRFGGKGSTRCLLSNSIGISLKKEFLSSWYKGSIVTDAE